MDLHRLTLLPATRSLFATRICMYIPKFSSWQALQRRKRNCMQILPHIRLKQCDDGTFPCWTKWASSFFMTSSGRRPECPSLRSKAKQRPISPYFHHDLMQVEGEGICHSYCTCLVASNCFMYPTAEITTLSKGLLFCWKYLGFLSFHTTHFHTALRSTNSLILRELRLVCCSQGLNCRGTRSAAILTFKSIQPVLIKMQSRKRWSMSSCAELQSRRVVSTWIPLLAILSLVKSFLLMSSHKKSLIFKGSLFSHT